MSLNFDTGISAYHRNIGPAEEASLTARRKEIYELLHPAKKDGGARKSKQVANAGDSADRHSKVQSKATGKSERPVQRSAKRGHELGDAILKRIEGTSLDKGEEMDALSRLPGETLERNSSGELRNTGLEFNGPIHLPLARLRSHALHR